MGTAKVEAFDNSNGTGSPIATIGNDVPANDQTINFAVGGLIKADTTYYFKVTHSDNIRPDLTNDPPPYPPFFTGVQAIGDVLVVASADSAIIVWDANVIGVGRVTYGPTSPDGPGSVDDTENALAHSVELTGLLPTTPYHFRVSNRHAIDGDSIAETTGAFTTLPSMPAAVQAITDLRALVASFGLARGTATSLDAKLAAALAAVQAGDRASACVWLADFRNEVRAQMGKKKLTAAQAQRLTDSANVIRTQLGC
jgi:hypothetical protein